MRAVLKGVNIGSAAISNFIGRLAKCLAIDRRLAINVRSDVITAVTVTAAVMADTCRHVALCNEIGEASVNRAWAEETGCGQRVQAWKQLVRPGRQVSDIEVDFEDRISWKGRVGDA